MKILFNGDNIKVTNYSFKVPSVKAFKNSSHGHIDDNNCYFLCLDHKIAIYIERHESAFKVVSYPIKINRKNLWIKYNHKDKWEKAGPVSQDKFRTYLLEQELSKI